MNNTHTSDIALDGWDALCDSMSRPEFVAVLRVFEAKKLQYADEILGTDSSPAIAQKQDQAKDADAKRPGRKTNAERSARAAQMADLVRQRIDTLGHVEGSAE